MRTVRIRSVAAHSIAAEGIVAVCHIATVRILVICGGNIDLIGVDAAVAIRNVMVNAIGRTGAGC